MALAPLHVSFSSSSDQTHHIAWLKSFPSSSSSSSVSSSSPLSSLSCIYSHAWWSYPRSLLLCLLPVERYYFLLFVNLSSSSSSRFIWHCVTDWTALQRHRKHHQRRYPYHLLQISHPSFYYSIISIAYIIIIFTIFVIRIFVLIWSICMSLLVCLFVCVSVCLCFCVSRHHAYISACIALKLQIQLYFNAGKAFACFPIQASFLLSTVTLKLIQRTLPLFQISLFLLCCLITPPFEYSNSECQ